MDCLVRASILIELPELKLRDLSMNELETLRNSDETLETKDINTVNSQENELALTGPSMTKGHIQTQYLLIISILGIMGGFISGLVPFRLLIETWYPFVGGTQLISGHYILWSSVAYGVTKRKDSMLLTAIIEGFIQFLLGSTWGILDVVLTLFEAALLVAGFAIIEKFGERNTNLGWGIASGLGNVTQVPLFWWLTGKFFVISNVLFIMAVMFGFASGVLITGLLGKAIVDRLRKAEII